LRIDWKISAENLRSNRGAEKGRVGYVEIGKSAVSRRQIVLPCGILRILPAAETKTGIINGAVCFGDRRSRHGFVKNQEHGASN